jgi:hypothetical protein
MSRFSGFSRVSTCGTSLAPLLGDLVLLATCEETTTLLDALPVHHGRPNAGLPPAFTETATPTLRALCDLIEHNQHLASDGKQEHN